MMMQFEVGKKYIILQPIRGRKAGEICVFKQIGYEIYYGVCHILFHGEDNDVFDLHLCNCDEQDAYVKRHLEEYFRLVDEDARDDTQGDRPTSELQSMRNIGKEIERKLRSVGICSAEELTRLGSKRAFLRLKSRYPNVCLVHLYTLQGAIDNVEYNQLLDYTKRELKSFYDRL